MGSRSRSTLCCSIYGLTQEPVVPQSSPSQPCSGLVDGEVDLSLEPVGAVVVYRLVLRGLGPSCPKIGS